MQSALGSGVSILKRMWRVIRWPLGILLIAYLGLVVYEIFAIPKRSAEVVAQIHAQKLTMKDVDGSNLPPIPDPKLVDATVEGIDANHNGIRDDVELAIFKKYPNDKSARAAALQYAMADQIFMTGKIIDKETWVTADEHLSRAISCMKKSGLDGNLGISALTYIEGVTTNTSARQHALESANKYISSSGTETGDACDLPQSHS